jgi:hypothetical protein
MKIRTIVGLLLVFALVLGSTGFVAADGVVTPTPDGDGPDQIQDRDDWICDEEGENCAPPGDGDGVCNDP